MAQAIAAYNGINYASNGEPEIGFLVGVRDYRTTVSLFALDSELEIAIVPNFVADNSGSFVGEIKINAEVVVTAVITTFKSTPDLLEKMKKESAENIHE